MLKSELIDKLNAISGDLVVLQAADAEGNSFSRSINIELSGVDDEGHPCHPDDAVGAAEKVIVFWP